MNHKKKKILLYIFTFRILYERYWSWWAYKR